MKPNAKAPQSVLFLIELMISFLVFAVTAAVCVRIFAGAHQISRQSEELSQAVVFAQNAAESLKSSRGDLEKAAGLLGGGTFSEDRLALCYDAEWALTDEANAVYRLILTRSAPVDGYMDAEAAVLRDGGQIYQITFRVLEESL